MILQSFVTATAKAELTIAPRIVSGLVAELSSSRRNSVEAVRVLIVIKSLHTLQGCTSDQFGSMKLGHQYILSSRCCCKQWQGCHVHLHTLLSTPRRSPSFCSGQEEGYRRSQLLPNASVRGEILVEQAGRRFDHFPPTNISRKSPIASRLPWLRRQPLQEQTQQQKKARDVHWWATAPISRQS